MDFLLFGYFAKSGLAAICSVISCLNLADVCAAVETRFLSLLFLLYCATFGESEGVCLLRELFFPFI